MRRHQQQPPTDVREVIMMTMGLCDTALDLGMIIVQLVRLTLDYRITSRSIITRYRFSPNVTTLCLAYGVMA